MDHLQDWLDFRRKKPRLTVFRPSSHDPNAVRANTAKFLRDTLQELSGRVRAHVNGRQDVYHVPHRSTDGVSQHRQLQQVQGGQRQARLNPALCGEPLPLVETRAPPEIVDDASDDRFRLDLTLDELYRQAGLRLTALARHSTRDKQDADRRSIIEQRDMLVRWNLEQFKRTRDFARRQRREAQRPQQGSGQKARKGEGLACPVFKPGGS
jgi:hypothetical protein